MDIHRCRFVPFPPSPVNALAFSQPFVRTTHPTCHSRLAVGRANGDIEIWNPLKGAWLQETVIQGGQDRSVDGLVWVVEPDEEATAPKGSTEKTMIPGRARLFSIGYTTAITEWDLEKKRPLRSESGQHGDIWCLAAQPAAHPKGKPHDSEAKDPTERVSKLVAGTIDGSLAIYTIEDGDLRFQRFLVKSPSRKTQMVSIAFQSRYIVVVGCSDSTLRAYDMRNGKLLRKMTLGSDLNGGAKEIIVWSVKCLPNGDIVSGDSTGHITIWDGKTYTQMQKIQEHRQDVLSLANSADGASILSGGMDRRTVLYKKTAGLSGRWSKVWGRKYHEHDVKALASFEFKQMSVVVSGGPDASLVVLPLKEMGRDNHRTLSYLPQQPPLQSASKSRLIISWWAREVHLWGLRQGFESLYSQDSSTDVTKNHKLLKRIVIKGESNIASAAISSDGSVLVVATATDVKAFHLRHREPSKPSDIKMSQIVLPVTLANAGARSVRISPDGNWLVLVQAAHKIRLLKINYEEQTPAIGKVQRMVRAKRDMTKQLAHSGLGEYERTISQIAFAADSKMLAVADLAGYIDTWILRGDSSDSREVSEDASSSEDDSSDSDEESADDGIVNGHSDAWHHTPATSLLPKLESSPVVLSFSNDVPALGNALGDSPSDYTLLAITAGWRIHAFHPIEGGLTRWSRRNPTTRLPEPIRENLSLAKGVLWQGPRAWVYGESFLFMIDLSQDFELPKDDSQALELAEKPNAALAKAGQKRKRRLPEGGAGSRMAIGSLVPQQVDRFSSEKQEWQLDIEHGAASSRSEGSDTDMVDADFGDDDDDLDEGTGGGELTALRNNDAVTENNEKPARKKWWLTFKYRPILGMVALDSSPSGHVNGSATVKPESDLPHIETVLVERPIWDVDLPERYAGEHEVERR